MKHLLIFVENYVAGGADALARTYADYLKSDQTTILYNYDDDTSILLKEPLSPHITPIPYSIPTIARLGSFANKTKKFLPIYILLKIFNLFIRYPLWLYSMCYFLILFCKIKPNIFLINNGGYPGGEWCRSATIASKIYSFIQGQKYPILHVIHSKSTKVFFILLAPIEFLIDFLVDKSSKIICVSHDNANSLLSFRYIKQKIEVVYTGVPIHQVKSYAYHTSNSLKLLNVAALYSLKNQMLILQAISLLENYNIELHLIGKEGENGYLEKLKDFAKQKNLKVFFHGFCNPSKFYQECDLFVLSSSVEGFPLVTLEAMSNGVPIISTYAGGVIEQIIPYHNGILIENSPQSLAKAIEFFITNPLEIEKMGRNAQKYVKNHFNFDKMVEKYNHLISKHTI